MDFFFCGNIEKHDSHTHEAKRTTVCSGSTLCGEKVHLEHIVENMETFYCGGICMCSFIKERHGPGNHK